MLTPPTHLLPELFSLAPGKLQIRLEAGAGGLDLVELVGVLQLHVLPDLWHLLQETGLETLDLCCLVGRLVLLVGQVELQGIFLLL